MIYNSSVQICFPPRFLIFTITSKRLKLMELFKIQKMEYLKNRSFFDVYETYAMEMLQDLIRKELQI